MYVYVNVNGWMTLTKTKKPRKRKCKVQTKVSRICPRETRKRYGERSRGVGEYIEKGSKNREKEKQKRK